MIPSFDTILNFFLNPDTGYEFANRFNSVKSNCSIMFTS